MNPLEYLITGFLVIMAIGGWVFVHAFRRADDAFENELGFQFGLAPAVKALEGQNVFVPPLPPQAIEPEVAMVKPRRPPSSKPPMLPAGMTLADFDTRQTGAPWMLKPPAASESPTNTPGVSPDKASKQ